MHGFGLAELGAPAFLVGAVIVITMATLLLHLLFPPAQRSSRRVGLRIRRIRCPLCDQSLNRAEIGGVRVAACPDCKGVWLSQDKLEQILG
jgi:phage FluMu protein Com